MKQAISSTCTELTWKGKNALSLQNNDNIIHFNQIIPPSGNIKRKTKIEKQNEQ